MQQNNFWGYNIKKHVGLVISGNSSNTATRVQHRLCREIWKGFIDNWACAALVKYKHSEEVISKLKENVADLEQKNRKAEEQLFFLKCITSNDSLVTFFTSFPNYQTTMALYEYLDPGVNSKNVKHWFSGKDIDGTTKCEKQGRPRTLKPLDEFFLTLCRLRQGLGELHLAQLFIAWVSGVSGGKGGREKWKRERAKGEKCLTDAFTGAFHPHTARLNIIQSKSLLVIGLLASCFK